MSLRKLYWLIPIVAAATCLVPASASAEQMDLTTAIRYAGTAPLLNGVDQPKQLTVSGCERQSTRAFVCSVTVDYKGAPQRGPTRVSAPTLVEKVRVWYSTRDSKTPRVKVVPGTAHVLG